MAVFETTMDALMHLKKHDKALGAVIERLGPLSVPLQTDLFTSMVEAIVSQQISGKAAQTVCTRLHQRLGTIEPKTVCDAADEFLQAAGMSFRKVTYIKRAAQAVLDGSVRLEHLESMDDQAVIAELTKLPGIGVWTAEMTLLFTLGRPDVLSWNDFGIRKGIMLLYRHEELDRTRFERYRKRYAPYGSTASLYLWKIAGGALNS